MRVRFTEVAPGLGPSELVVSVLTVEGKREEVVISRRQANDGSMEIGSPIMDGPAGYLVEFPRESLSGRWRVWVPRSEIVDPRTAQAAE